MDDDSNPTFKNVFSGQDSLLKFYDPDQNMPTPMVELPHHPFVGDRVRIYAKMMNLLPAANIKSLPVLNMLKTAVSQGQLSSDTRTVVEYSSGSTAISLAIISRLLGVDRASAYITNKTSAAKIDMMRLFGLELTLFGGPSQPEPQDPIGGIAAAASAGKKSRHYNPNQYENTANYEAHIKWTGPQIYQQLPEINVFCAPVGTSGTMTGTSMYLKSVRPQVVTVGAFTSPGQRIPGPRTLALMRPVQFPWQEVIDEVVEIETREAFDLSMTLCRAGIIVGPSSGMSLAGIYRYLRRSIESGTLDSFRDSTGEITCAFMCCDFPFQYTSEYIEKCSPELLPPLHNQELLGVDQHPYLTEWDLTPAQAYEKLGPHLESPLVIDFRHPAAFVADRVNHSVSIDVGLGFDDPNPFQDPGQLRDLCHRLQLVLEPDQLLARAIGPPGGGVIIAICQNGHGSRTATSMMRSRGYAAYCVLGGINSWKQAGLPFLDNISHEPISAAEPNCWNPAPTHQVFSSGQVPPLVT